MNYAVYTARKVDGIEVCNIVAYQIVSTESGRGIQMMTQSDAELLAAAITDPTTLKMVLPLNTDRAITAA